MQALLLGLMWTSGAHAASAPPVAEALSSRDSTAHNIAWQYTGVAAECELLSDGSVYASSGAELAMHCAAQASVLGNVQLHLPASAWQQRRVIVVAEVKTDAATSASFWLKTWQGTQQMMLEDDTELQWLQGAEADQWVERQLTIPVVAGVDQLSVGVRVQGAGTLALRKVRVLVSEPGVMAAPAEQWLETALQFLKSRTAARTDVSWRVLEPQARILAAGAQTPSEVYPAIRYLLSRLGGQSLLLTPALAYLFQGTSKETSALSLTLPDGARLILANEATRSFTTVINAAVTTELH